MKAKYTPNPNGGLNVELDKEELQEIMTQQKAMDDAWGRIIDEDEINNLSDDIFTEGNDVDGEKLERLIDILGDWSREVDKIIESNKK